MKVKATWNNKKIFCVQISKNQVFQLQVCYFLQFSIVRMFKYAQNDRTLKIIFCKLYIRYKYLSTAFKILLSKRLAAFLILFPV